MDAAKLYKTQLLFIHLFGFSLDYQIGWRGNLKKFSIFFIAISNLFTVALSFHYIFSAKYSLEELTDAVACLLALLEIVVKLFVFYNWRPKFRDLFNDMRMILNSGNSLSADRFDRITKIGRFLSKMYLISTVSTTYTYIFGAFYKMYANNERVFPYKVR